MDLLDVRRIVYPWRECHHLVETGLDHQAGIVRR
jgi:hypothetical protein